MFLNNNIFNLSIKYQTMRDDEWLDQRFEQLWQLFFPDVEKKNVYIRWKGKWKNKFGHIENTKDGQIEIAINKLFKDFRVPEDVIKLTIAHEIVHYSHGFHSHLPKLYKHPHKGGVVDKDLKKRGFTYMIAKEKSWIKREWEDIYRELMPHKFTSQKVQENRTKQKSILNFFKS
tara:strand:+ start:6957 stop:7478 length:522 start_codon:yes stop_codon:yes gene_type:complete